MEGGIYQVSLYTLYQQLSLDKLLGAVALWLVNNCKFNGCKHVNPMSSNTGRQLGSKQVGLRVSSRGWAMVLETKENYDSKLLDSDLGCLLEIHCSYTVSID